ncbi:MAG TPA: GH92 family glycosyl hydrolase, partial [Paludibacter sp.]|nr:GH92 family glycosyl hydrolase [Paludibacter sp.]
GKKVFGQDERASWFSHKAETALPYYYSVYLADHDVKVEITPTERSACFSITFPQSEESYIVVDAFDNGSYINVDKEKQQITGYTTKNSGGVPANFKNFFVIQFDKPFRSVDICESGKILENQGELKGNHAGAIVGFSTCRGEKIHLKVSSSFISSEQARLNMNEIGSKSFEQVKDEAKNRWNEVLGKIEVEGGSTDQFRTFYSSLYRCLLFPRKLYEINGRGEVVHYSPYNGKIEPGYMFTDTGFWDTFRALFPLLNLVYPSVNAEIQGGLVNAYKESGFLPEWASPGHRNCMVGNNSASIVADAFLSGVKVSGIDTLYQAVLHGANAVHPKIPSTGRLGYEYYNRLGYVPCDVDIKENVARTLEYAYDDWCIMKLGESLNRPKAETKLYARRSQNYRNVFDTSTNLMRGKGKDGKFAEPFNPFKWGDAFTEGNSWHYTWSVFHDIRGLINLMGGQKNFVQMLDSVFILPPVYDDSYYGTCIHEIKEMQIMNMGNYAHGNQPIQHMVYLYGFTSNPWKAQYWAREVMDKLYTPNPDGYCGDEDNGQTSAWYVFSALGFYPVCPGSGEYVIGSPLFPKAAITLDNGNKVTISALGNNATTRYIDAMTLNGKPYPNSFLKQSDLKQGATINFSMSTSPNYKRAVEEQNFPYSFSNSDKNK